MSEERTAWVVTVPSVMAWTVAHAGRRVIPCQSEQLAVGDLLLIRARHGRPKGFEALEAYLGHEITNRPESVVVASATLAEWVGPVPKEQEHWTLEPSLLLSDVRPLAIPVWHKRGGRPYRASPPLVGRVRIQER